MTTTLHPLADAYLERLRKAARSLPRSRREELLADIEAHLAEAGVPDVRGNGSVRTCTGGTGGSSHAGFLVLLAALVVLSFVAVHLARRAQSHPAA